MLGFLMQKRTEQVERHRIQVMGPEGDKSVEWTTNNPAELAEARKVFEQIKEKGGSVFRAQPGGVGGGAMKEFDPRADMIAVPLIVGG